MILLTLLVATALGLECCASLIPGTPPPEIEDDALIPGTPPPEIEDDFELTNPGATQEGEELFQSDVLLSKEQWEAVRERKAINYEGSRWPEGSDGYPLVPYVYSDSNVDQDAVKAGINHWMEHTCIKFEETSNANQAHLQFFLGRGCWSYVGVSSSTGQQISIGNGCTSLGTVAHEIGHAMGFWHEQSRTDRDDHVVIKYDNIVEDNKHNFNKHDTNNYDIKYDYGSDMHYGSFYFHKNGKMTIVTKDPFAQELIASRAGLSHRDKLLANKMYKCIDKWVSKCGLSADPCKNEGYLGSNCACVCAPGTSGTNCETVTDDYYAHLRSEHTEMITTEKTISHVGSAKYTKKIVAPTCKKVKLTFTNFELYAKVTSSSGLTYCYWEYIFLRFGTDLTEGEIFCAMDIAAGQSFTSETDTMILYSEAKYSDISDGWSAKVEFVSDPGCTPPTTKAPATSATTTEITTTAKPTEKSDSCRCGQKKAGTRIINGKETDVLEYPWQAGLVSTGGTRTWCGGSLINSNWVLTAAHCTVSASPSQIQVLLAEHDVTVSESHTERFSLKRIINHPDYGQYPWTNGHDVSLLELDGKVNFETSQARPICLPTGDDTYAEKVVTLTGFGRIGHDQPQSDYLREVDIDVITNAQCSRYYGGSESDYNTMICAGKSDGSGTGGCMGDSGGPLIYKESAGNYVQVGVVSFGSSKCNSYGVFARVTDLTTWITSYTNTGSPDICSP